MLSTGEAAQLVGVHESTIKRWCDAQDLACSLTEGGHRRIALKDLLSLARAERLNCPLLPFDVWAEDVWEAIDQLRRGGKAEPLINLVQTWLKTSWSVLPGELMLLCLREGIPLPQLFDKVLRPLLHRIGDQWKGGCLQIGDEHRMTNMVRDALEHVRRHVRGDVEAEAERRMAVVGCAGGTEHELGAVMVRIFLEQQGWDVVFLGGRVPTEDFVLQQKKYEASLVGISMTPPLIPTDVRRLVRVLSGLGDAEHPFHLAIGGSAVEALVDEEIPSHPFASCRFYDAIAPFAAWLHNNGVSSFTPER